MRGSEEGEGIFRRMPGFVEDEYGRTYEAPTIDFRLLPRDRFSVDGKVVSMRDFARGLEGATVDYQEGDPTKIRHRYWSFEQVIAALTGLGITEEQAKAAYTQLAMHDRITVGGSREGWGHADSSEIWVSVHDYDRYISKMFGFGGVYYRTNG